MNTKPTLLTKYFIAPAKVMKSKPTESFLNKKRQTEALERISLPLLKTLKTRYCELNRFTRAPTDEVLLQEKMNSIEEIYARGDEPSDSDSD